MSRSIIAQIPLEELKRIVKTSDSIKEVLIKTGYNTFGGNNFKTVKKYLDDNGIDYSHFSSVAHASIVRSEDNIFIEDSTATQSVLRRWYKKGNYSPYKCAICGLPPEWQGKELVLTLDHINGDNHDDRLENLRWVCPNCDRQLPTYGFKGKGKIQKLAEQLEIPYEELKKEQEQKRKKYCVDCGKEITSSAERCIECASKLRRKSDRPNREELKAKIRTQSFLAIGKEYDVSDNAIRKWCIAENLPYKKREIQSYSDEEWEKI